MTTTNPDNLPPDDDRLTPRERLFVAHYTGGRAAWNGTKAAKAAGYSGKRPDQQAYELLRKPEIQAAIKTAMDAIMPAGEVLSLLAQQARGSMGDFLRVDEEEVTLEMSVAYLTDQERDRLVLQGMAELRELRGDATEAGDRDPNAPAPKAVLVRTATVRRAVARLDLLAAKKHLHLIKKYSLDEKTGKVAIELYDAQSALEKLGKYHKLFVDKTEHSFVDDIDWTLVSDEMLSAYRAGKASLDDVRRSITSNQ